MMSDQMKPEAPGAETAQSRRAILRLGAVAAPAMLMVKPAMAQTAASVLACEIPLTVPVNKDGKPVDPTTIRERDIQRGKVFMPPSSGKYFGQEIRDYYNNGSVPNPNPDAFKAHLKYIKNLQMGDQGYTCFVSIQQTRVFTN